MIGCVLGTEMTKITVLACLLVPCGLLAIYLGGDAKKRDTLPDQEFVARAMSSLRFEIEAGGLAYALGTDTGLVAFGAQMASDCGAACTELAGLAALKGLSVPDDLWDGDQLLLDSLSAPDRRSFDQKFARYMEGWHRETVALFEWAIGSGGVDDEELRQWALAKLVILRQHPYGSSVSTSPSSWPD